MDLTPRQIGPGDPALADVLTLIQTAFADMDGRIDPPSSMHRLTRDSMTEQAATGEIWCIGQPPMACMVLTLKPDCLYLGKLAVAPGARGQGLARRLVHWAETRAAALQRPCVDLQTRVELTENHKVFEALGFHEVARTAHPGYDRPTSITYRKQLSPQIPSAPRRNGSTAAATIPTSAATVNRCQKDGSRGANAPSPPQTSA